MHRHLTRLLVAFAICAWLQTHAAEATITNYSGDEVGFTAAINSLPTTLIDFEDRDLGDVIHDQYSPPVVFSTTPPQSIVTDDDAHDTSAMDTRCAEVTILQPDDPFSHWSFTFAVPVQGVSLWVGDINIGGGQTAIDVFDSEGALLDSFTEGRQDDWSYMALLSDSNDIGRIDFLASADGAGDGQGFDNVTIVGYAPFVPTVGEWGLVAMMLLVLTAGTLVYARRRPAHRTVA